MVVNRLAGIGRHQSKALLVLLRDPDSSRAAAKVGTRLLDSLKRRNLVTTDYDHLGYLHAALTEEGRATAEEIAELEEAIIREYLARTTKKL